MFWSTERGTREKNLNRWLPYQGSRSHRSYSDDQRKPQGDAKSVGLQEAIELIVEYINENHLRDTVLLGHSSGGMIIAGVADRVPDRMCPAVMNFAFEPGTTGSGHHGRRTRLTTPDVKILMPGVICRATNVIEHPEYVAERILRFATIVGRDNLIAATDCGFRARIHPQIAWAKRATLVEGARLASRKVLDLGCRTPTRRSSAIDGTDHHRMSDENSPEFAKQQSIMPQHHDRPAPPIAASTAAVKHTTVALAALTLAALLLAAPGVAREGAVLTPLILAVENAPTPFRGSDGNTHLVYELFVTNFSSGSAAVEGVAILSGDDTVLARLDAAAVAGRLQPAGQRESTGTLAPGMQALLFLHVTLARNVPRPERLSHRITARISAAPPGNARKRRRDFGGRKRRRDHRSAPRRNALHRGRFLL